MSSLDAPLSAQVLASKANVGETIDAFHMLPVSPWGSPTAGVDKLSLLKFKHLSPSASGLSLSTGQKGTDWKCRRVNVARNNLNQ